MDKWYNIAVVGTRAGDIKEIIAKNLKKSKFLLLESNSFMRFLSGYRYKDCAAELNIQGMVSKFLHFNSIK